jgi:hypothetical protein
MKRGLVHASDSGATGPPTRDAPAPARTRAELIEQNIAGMRWLVVRGSRGSCFRILGDYARSSIHHAVDDLHRRAADARARSSDGWGRHVGAVVDATAERFPVHVGELEALGAGAGVPLDTLLDLNLQGDLAGVGAQPDTGAGGCSDIGVLGDHVLLAHNEDEDLASVGRVDLLTLRVDGDPALWALWYPGMLPSNAFTLSEHLAWGVDHLPVTEPLEAPGRSFVARALQRIERLDDAVAFLRSEPSAGGFAYSVASGSDGRIVSVETAAGACALAEADAQRRPVLWHTNHVRYLPEGSGRPRHSSLERGAVLAGVTGGSAAAALDRDRLFAVLTRPCPDGVRQEGKFATLCSVVADLTAREVFIAPGPGDAGAVSPRPDGPDRMTVDELLAGAERTRDVHLAFEGVGDIA